MSYGIIYKIENKINGKIYIGQTTKNFDERYRGSIKNTHNKHLKRSIAKHDIENFEIDKCLCECDSEEELNEAEKFYIDFFDSANPEHGYNMTLGGEGVIANEETRKKISEANSGENNGMWGKCHSEETKKKQSEAQKGKYCGEKHPMYNKHHLQETKQKISNSLKGKYSGKKNPSARAVIQLDKNGKFIRKYDFIKQAAKELNINRQSISDCCKGRRKSAGGYMWKYEDEFISRTTGDTLVPDINTHI